MITVETVSTLDAGDPLAAYRELFHISAGLIYLDGNSLGLMPKRVHERVATVLGREWAEGLIGSWTSAGWMQLPKLVGEQIAPLIGARTGEVVVGDSTSVNLFKCLCAALKARPGRKIIVTEAENFPTDNYIIQGVAHLLGDYDIRYAATGEDPRSLLDSSVAAVLLTHVSYRSAAVHDLTAITKAAHAAGALMIWDLSHSVGALPLDMNAADVDFAVGCTYKYLNGGPGAPAFVYVPQRLSGIARQPLSGWMGHRRPFAFELAYEPGEAASRFLCGTPQILSLAALSESLALWKDVDMTDVREKSLRMTSLFMDLIEQECAGFGLGIATPRAPARRGSHVAVSCEVGYPVMRALADRGVVGDFRAPNLMRFGFAPLYGSYREVYQAAQILKDVLAAESWRDERYAKVLDVT